MQQSYFLCVYVKIATMSKAVVSSLLEEGKTEWR